MRSVIKSRLEKLEAIRVEEPIAPITVRKLVDLLGDELAAEAKNGDDVSRIAVREMLTAAEDENLLMKTLTTPTLMFVKRLLQSF